MQKVLQGCGQWSNVSAVSRRTEWEREHENSVRQNVLGNAVKNCNPLLTQSTVLTFLLYFSSFL